MRDSEESWMSTREAAEQLKVGIRQLYRLIDEGRLVAYRVERDIKLRPADVDAYRASSG